ncbi:hypothetical protein [Maribacter sp. ACAM166]|uniref:hypothetical protein n=1 Tax=Maribacter sp. ACAM166 TaxID=2508996 RepID=UPI0010FD0C08|nr:hypothetical protein [Maribacter sp. ACAM166]TLP75878.1 hypothetical protein ES765_14425 [Maribacter sp. ACAM166]
MIQLMSKSLRIFFLGITPLFLAACVSKTDRVYSNLDSGVNQFEFSGPVNYNSVGSGFSQNIVENDVFTNEVNILKLNFKSKYNSHLDLIQFLISPNPLGANHLSAGIYEIKNLNQLIKRYNGVECMVLPI